MKTAYLQHLLLWMLPVIAVQWAIAGKILGRNIKAILLPTLLLGIYLSAADSYAVSRGIWFFDPNQTLGITIGNLPLEECLFFFLTGLLVSQSLVMFLPPHLRANPSLP